MQITKNTSAASDKTVMSFVKDKTSAREIRDALIRLAYESGWAYCSCCCFDDGAVGITLEVGEIEVQN